MASCYDCIHCDVCSGIGACSYHCSDVTKCKYFKNKEDFVEVVRCKNCHYLNNDYWHCDFWSDENYILYPDSKHFCGNSRRIDT